MDRSRDTDPGPVNIGAEPPVHETGAGARRGRSGRFPVAVPLAIVLLAGTLAVTGWQTHWPRAIFGVRPAAAAKQLPTRPVSTPASGSADSGGSGSSPAPSSAGSGSPAAPATASATGPPVATAVIIVKEYFAAINHGHYAKAWRLGGSNFSPSFAAYVAGFQGTVHDVVTIISVKRNVVTASLAARQADGTTKVYQGTYTVVNNVITKSSIQQVS